MPYRRRSTSRKRARSAPARRRRSYAKKRSSRKKSVMKVKNLSKAGKSKAKVELLLKNPSGVKLFGIPKESNKQAAQYRLNSKSRVVGVPLNKVSGLEIKVAKNGLVRLSGKGPGGMKLFRGVGRAK